jgi:hypothetical protein
MNSLLVFISILSIGCSTWVYRTTYVGTTCSGTPIYVTTGESTPCGVATCFSSDGLTSAKSDCLGGPPSMPAGYSLRIEFVAASCSGVFSGFSGPIINMCVPNGASSSKTVCSGAFRNISNWSSSNSCSGAPTSMTQEVVGCALGGGTQITCGFSSKIIPCFLIVLAFVFLAAV